jgi:hypothetical protein
MRTALLTFFTIVLLSTALAASALGAIGSSGSGAVSDVIAGPASAERQVDGTPEALPPVVLLPPTSGVAPVIVVPVAAGPGTPQLPNTSTAPSTASLTLLVAGAGVAAGLMLLVLAGRRR